MSENEAIRRINENYYNPWFLYSARDQNIRIEDEDSRKLFEYLKEGLHRVEGFAGFLRSIERLKDVESCIDDPRDSQDLSQFLTLHAFRPPFKSLEIFADPPFGYLARFCHRLKNFLTFLSNSSKKSIFDNLISPSENFMYYRF